MAPPNAELLFEFSLDGDETDLRVIRFEGHEALSRPFEFDLTLVSSQPDLDLDAALQKTATLTLHTRDRARTVPYHGMLASIEQLGGVDRYYFYRAVLVPRLWKLGLNLLNEVYLDEQRIPELIEDILKRNGIEGDDLVLKLKDLNAYRQRSFVCQYQESDLAFISRWMEREGLYYYFDHDRESGGEALIILDHQQGQPEAPIALRYTPPENVQTDRQDHCVTAFSCYKTHLPADALIQDFDYRRASMGDTLRSEQAIRGGSHGLYMLYGLNLRAASDREVETEVQRLTRIFTEAVECRGTTFRGESPAVGVRSGYGLNLENHFRADYNGAYLITQVHHEGSQAGVVLAGQNTAYNRGEQGSVYQCRFNAIPGALQYRSALDTPRPTMPGVMSAIIDAEGSGQTAELNEYGQYKVQLLYDHTAKHANKGSSWLRMASAYAGSRQGMHFPLLKGTEVLLGFNQGDPDQPIILAAIPNSESPSVVTSDNATRSGILTAGGNRVVMDDREGSELVFLYSPTQKSFLRIGAPSSADGGDQAQADTPQNDESQNNGSRTAESPADSDPQSVLGAL